MKIYHDQSIFAQPLSGFFLKHTALKTVKFPQYPRIQYPTVSLSIPSHVPALSQSAFRRQQRQLMLLIEQQLKEKEEAELELQGVGTTLVGPGGSMLQWCKEGLKQRISEANFASYDLPVSSLSTVSCGWGVVPDQSEATSGSAAGSKGSKDEPPMFTLRRGGQCRLWCPRPLDMLTLWTVGKNKNKKRLL